MPHITSNVSSGLPIYRYSGFREFLPNERHINQQLPVHVMIIMSAGTLYFRENGQDITLHQDEYYIQRANSVLEGIIPSIQPKYFYLCFNDDTLDDYFQGLPLRGNCPYRKLSSKINDLHLAYLSPAKDFIEEAYRFYDIIRTLKNNYAPAPSSAVAKVTQLLQENFQTNMDLASIAKSTNYSVNYLIREFKAYHGITPHQYLLQLRLENAKTLLMSSNATLPEIASLCGFRDSVSLHRAFSNKLGQTPGQYRKLHAVSQQSQNNSTPPAKLTKIF